MFKKLTSAQGLRFFATKYVRVFKDISTPRLLLNFCIYQACQYPILVKNSQKLVNVSQSVFSLIT